MMNATTATLSPSSDGSPSSDAALEAPSPAAPSAAAPTPDSPPDGGYGWICVACVFLINAHTWGLNSSYGVFLAYYLSHSTFPSASALDFAFVGGLSISQALLVAPVATLVTRTFSTRATLLVGIALETLSLIGASFATQVWQLYLSQGVCFGWGMGFLFVGSVGIIPQWFTTKRSLANGVGAAGSGLGGLVYSLAANAIIQRISLGWAFRILGIVAFAVNFTCAMLVRDRNRQVGSSQALFDYSLLARPEFLGLLAWGFFSMLAYIVLLFSLPNYASNIGLTAHQGSVVGALLNLGQALGRPPIVCVLLSLFARLICTTRKSFPNVDDIHQGYFSDTFGRINMAATMTFLAGLFALVIWIFASSFGVLVFYALIGGTVAGTFWATIGPVGAEVIGLKDLNAGLTITWIALVLPCTFSEPIALEIANHSPVGYLGTQLFAGFMYLAACMCLLAVRVWKIGELERGAAEMAYAEKDRPYEASRVSSKMSRLLSIKRV